MHQKSRTETEWTIQDGELEFRARSGRTLLNAARERGISIPHTCGGRGQCLTCRCEVIEGDLGEPNAIEKQNESRLRGSRLACQAVPRSNVELKFRGPVRRSTPIRGEITLAEENRLEITVPSRPNHRLEKDRALLLNTETALALDQPSMNAHLAALAESDRLEYEAGSLSTGPQFASENFSDEDYHAARRREKLLYFNLEFSNQCNLACRGCFAGFGDVSNVFETENPEPGYRHTKEVEGPMIVEELQDIIDQAADLGAKTVDLIGGGEPLMSDLFFILAEHAASRGLTIEVFTNGTLITSEKAKRMAELKITPFVKLYSSRSWIHDEMVGAQGAWRKAVAGIENLLEAGFGGEAGLPISLETIVVRRNHEDLPTLWRWARENGMIPYFERFVGCHYDGDPGELLTPVELKKLWEDLWLLDRGEYGISWPMLPLRVGYTCPTNFYSFYINYEGDVRPCSGLFEPLGNVREISLRKILETVPAVRDLREFEREPTSWCAGCYYLESDRCPGCRGMAQVAGHYLADDPLCFHNPANLQQSRDSRATPHLLAQERP